MSAESPPLVPTTTGSSSATPTANTGGAGLGAPAEPPSTLAHPTVTGDVARVIHGVGYAPSYAPMAVKEAIWAGDQIRHKSYIYGGGHRTWKSTGCDCSESVS